jgi:purine-binding chemotaxis protein CheW
MSKIGLSDRPQSDATSNDFPKLSDFNNQFEVASESKKFVVFYLNGELFAVLAEAVREIVQPLDITTLPFSPKWLEGIINLRGEIVAVINFLHICQQTLPRPLPKTKIIVFHPLSFDLPVAFFIDKVSEIINFSPANIASAEETHLGRKILLNSDSVSLLDTDKIFSSLLSNT